MTAADRPPTYTQKLQLQKNAERAFPQTNPLVGNDIDSSIRAVFGSAHR